MDQHLQFLEAVIRKAMVDHSDIHAQWVKISHKSFGQKEDPWLMAQLQQVGRIDIFLRTYNPSSFYGHNGEDVLASFDFLTSLSGLWLVGLFEILRTARKPEYEAFKKKLSFIRSPMVKHQISGKKNMDIAFPTMHEKGRLGWKITSPDTGLPEFFIREELSDEFLAITI